MDVSSLEVSNFDKEIIKGRVRDSVLSSYKDTGKTLGGIWYIENSF